MRIESGPSTCAEAEDCAVPRVALLKAKIHRSICGIKTFVAWYGMRLSQIRRKSPLRSDRNPILTPWCILLPKESQL